MTARLATASILAIAVAGASSALAQVSTNTEALQGLGPATPSHHAVHHLPPRREARGHEARDHEAASRPAPHRPAGHAAPAAARSAIPTMPAHPPPLPVIAPPAIHVPLHPPPPPPAVPVDPTAHGTASTGPGGVTTLDFGSGSAGLNAAMMAAVRGALATLRAHPDDIAIIDSYAAGSADDPSMPRRLSLQRALAVRAVMINGGIPSTRIFARANGAPPPPSGPSASDRAASDPDRTLIAERDENASGAFAPVLGAAPAPAPGPVDVPAKDPT